jgi:hypothetical protein
VFEIVVAPFAELFDLAAKTPTQINLALCRAVRFYFSIASLFG